MIDKWSSNGKGTYTQFGYCQQSAKIVHVKTSVATKLQSVLFMLFAAFLTLAFISLMF